MNSKGPSDRSRISLSLHKSLGHCLLALTLWFFTSHHINSASAAETLSSTVTSSSRIGPGFDCTKAVTPLGLMICRNDDLSKLDLEFVQAYQALRQQVGDTGVSQLREEAVEFQSTTLLTCGIPEQGEVAGSSDCLRTQYSKQRAIWVSRLSGAALEEATRPIDLHIKLQTQLQQLGYLPATATIDGIYGPATRSAIVAWQNAVGQPTDGFLSNTDAGSILQNSTNIPSAVQPPVLADNQQTPAPTPAPPAPAEEATDSGLRCYSYSHAEDGQRVGLPYLKCTVVADNVRVVAVELNNGNCKLIDPYAALRHPKPEPPQPPPRRGNVESLEAYNERLAKIAADTAAAPELMSKLFNFKAYWVYGTEPYHMGDEFIVTQSSCAHILKAAITLGDGKGTWEWNNLE